MNCSSLADGSHEDFGNESLRGQAAVRVPRRARLAVAGNAHPAKPQTGVAMPL